MILTVDFVELPRKLDASFSILPSEFKAEFGDIQLVTKYVGEQYLGEYSATPKVVEQTLPTKDKVLIEDITIKSIPYFDVSNNSGGSTVYIGDEV